MITFFFFYDKNQINKFVFFFKFSHIQTNLLYRKAFQNLLFIGTSKEIFSFNQYTDKCRTQTLNSKIINTNQIH